MNMLNHCTGNLPRTYYHSYFNFNWIKISFRYLVNITRYKQWDSFHLSFLEITERCKQIKLTSFRNTLLSAQYEFVTLQGSVCSSIRTLMWFCLMHKECHKGLSKLKTCKKVPDIRGDKIVQLWFKLFPQTFTII